MIGLLNRNSEVFEFLDNDQLARALDFVASKYDKDNNVIFISSLSDKIVGVIYNEGFVEEPIITEETEYRLRFFRTARDYDPINLPSKNTMLTESQRKVDSITFRYFTARIPKRIE